MPKLNFGEKASFDGRSSYLELSSKGDKVHVRFLDSPVYDGKHFIKDGEKWIVSYCPRIMANDKCAYCEKFFKAKAEKKELGDPKTYSADAKKKADELDKVARRYNAAITFYYPVIDREKEEARILKAGLSIRTELDNQVAAGIDVLKYDFIITRLKGKITDPGKDWYSFVRVDSAESKEFTDKELEETAKALAWDLEKMVVSNSSSQKLSGKEEE